MLADDITAVGTVVQDGLFTYTLVFDPADADAPWQDESGQMFTLDGVDVARVGN